MSAFRNAVGAALLAGGAVLASPIPGVSADPTGLNGVCPDVEVVFARGTSEVPGVGYVGQALVNSLSARIAPKSLGVYAVNYPASTDFPTAFEGVNDVGLHVQQMAASCPATRMVLGGYSQGAAVMGFLTLAPIPPEVAYHVAAVTLLGTPSPQMMHSIGLPPLFIGPLYAFKTLQLCAPGDPICGAGQDSAAHTSYVQIGMADEAAAYAASQLD